MLKINHTKRSLEISKVEVNSRFRCQSAMRKPAVVISNGIATERSKPSEIQNAIFSRVSRIVIGLVMFSARTTTERETGHFVTENTPKELPGFHPKTDPKIDECPINRKY